MSNKVPCTGDCGVQYHVSGTAAAMNCYRNDTKASPKVIANMAPKLSSRPDPSAYTSPYMERELRNAVKSIHKNRDGSFTGKIDWDLSHLEEDSDPQAYQKAVDSEMKMIIRERELGDGFKYQAGELDDIGRQEIIIDSDNFDDVALAIMTHEGIDEWASVEQARDRWNSPR